MAAAQVRQFLKQPFNGCDIGGTLKLPLFPNGVVYSSSVRIGVVTASTKPSLITLRRNYGSIGEATAERIKTRNRFRLSGRRSARLKCQPAEGVPRGFT